MNIAPQFGKGAAPVTPTTSWDISNVLKGTNWADSYYGPGIKAAEDALTDFKGATGSRPGFFHPTRLKLWWLNTKQTIAKELLNYDFVGFHNYKMGPFKVLFSTPPRGALVAFAYIGLEVARAKRAWERRWVKDDAGNKIKQDFRELRDIAIRDTWSIAVYIWGLPVFNKLFLNAGNKASGIVLAEKGDPDGYTYAQHQANRTLGNVLDTHGKVLATAKDRYLANLLEGSHQGMVKAAQSNTFLGIPRGVFKRLGGLGNGLLEKLDQWAELRRQYTTEIEHDAGLAKSFLAHPNQLKKSPAELFERGKAYFAKEGGLKGSETLGKLTQLQAEIVAAAKKQSPTVGAWVEKNWAQSDHYLARAAKSWAAGMGIASFGVVLFLIGWLPVAYNAWYTNKEFSRLKAEQAKISPLLQLSKRASLLHSQPYAPYA
ncbi:MAG: hypothetical protein QE263_10140 [Vampirovibrionales bacterium]|nr:hypothetical protein [Vampirovibrionales bacterium]